MKSKNSLFFVQASPNCIKRTEA